MAGAITYDDQVWMSEERKLAGICRETADAIGSGLNVLVVAHFEMMLSVVARKLRASSTPYRTSSFVDGIELCAANRAAPRTAEAWLVLASHLPATGAFAVASKPAGVTLRVLVAEHHPLLARDESLLASLAQLPCRCRTTFYVALDDALLSRFVGESTRNLMRKLGQTEDESLSHPLISTAIRSAQEKVCQQMRGEIPTLSADEWLAHNMQPKT